MNLSLLSALWSFASASTAEEPTNRPLAIATIVISVIAIVLTIVYLARRSGRGTETTSDELLAAIDSVEWYGDDVGERLVEAEPVDRAAIVDEATDRIGRAHAELINAGASSDDQRWKELIIELTATENAYGDFADGSNTDPGRIRQHQQVLSDSLERLRSTL